MDKKESIDKNIRKPILCLDFDGVCHSYTSGWRGIDVIPDPPVDGLFEFLEFASPYFDIQIYSARSRTKVGRDSMLLWFLSTRQEWRKTENGQKAKEVLSISFPETKPPASVSLDDRALTFTGVWPDIKTLRNFKPWHK